jgi:hypothetical protein
MACAPWLAGLYRLSGLPIFRAKLPYPVFNIERKQLSSGKSQTGVVSAFAERNAKADRIVAS